MFFFFFFSIHANINSLYHILNFYVLYCTCVWIAYILCGYFIFTLLHCNVCSVFGDFCFINMCVPFICHLFIEWSLENWLPKYSRLVEQGLWVRMNLEQIGQPKSSNGYIRRKSEKEGATKSDYKIPSGKSNASSRLASTGELQICHFYYFLYYLLLCWYLWLQV